ncbi:MAG: DUF1501 domain-containing protein [Isosphaeraceae bacterium]
MLTIGGRNVGSFCDGLSRRDFLGLGALAMGGLAWPGLLRAEAGTGISRSHKAIIMVFLAGGPPHQDMVDLKPDAPADIRGDFRPIATNLPGFQVCEHMPRLARMMDRFAVVRSIVGSGPDHSAGQCMTGYKDLVSRAQGGRPSEGARRLEAPRAGRPDVPPFVGLCPRTGEPRWANPGDPGYLGLAHAPFTPFRGEQAPGKSKHSNGSPGLALDEKSILPQRLTARRGLLAQLDDFRRMMDRSDAMDGMDAFTRSAFEVLTSRRVYEALDLSREDPRLRARYGIGDMNNESDGPPCCMDHFLIARRLVEAGVRVVTVGFGRWDTHSDNFRTNAKRIPKLDMALSALVEDLHRRGLDRDVSVVVWGEFGRTPLINKQAGRDHWPPANFAMLAGGGMRTGQVIGATDRHGAYVTDRPVPFQSIFATLYHNLGIDPATLIPDRSGRPVTLLEDREPLRELV